MWCPITIKEIHKATNLQRSVPLSTNIILQFRYSFAWKSNTLTVHFKGKESLSQYAKAELGYFEKVLQLPNKIISSMLYSLKCRNNKPFSISNKFPITHFFWLLHIFPQAILTWICLQWLPTWLVSLSRPRVMRISRRISISQHGFLKNRLLCKGSTFCFFFLPWTSLDCDY